MKKLRTILLFTVGFIVVFLSSGFISYLAFDRDDRVQPTEADEIKLPVTMEESENSGGAVAVTDENNLTIITPGLNEVDSVIRKGTMADIDIETLSNEKNETATELFSDNEPLEEEEIEEEKPKEEKPEEEKPKEEKPEEEKPKEEEKPEEENPKEEEKPETEKPEEEKPKEEQKPEEQKPQLNPNVQTSDSGL